MNMYPLQTNVTNFSIPSVSSEEAMFFGIAIGVLILIFLILNILKNRFRIPGLSGSQSGRSSRRRYSSHALHRLTSQVGLDREQFKMLDFVMRNDGVTDPERSFVSPNLLDRHFKRAYRSIAQTSVSDEDLNRRLSVLFSLRNNIEAKLGANTSSTRQIPENSAAVIAVDNANYPVKVISSKGDSLVVENPVTRTGSPLRIPRGRKVSISFFTQSSKGFSVDSHVLDTMETPDGTALQLVHSGQLKRLSSRRFRRRQISVPANFYYVRVEDTFQRKRERKLVIDKQKYTGSIVDISIGGCSIKAIAPLKSGQHIKVEFAHNTTNIAALGEVLRLAQAGRGAVMHIKFLKIPRKSLNAINAMVYEYID